MNDVRPLRLEDIPACLALAEKRGWPAESEKWRMLLWLGQGFGIDHPDGGLAATVLVIDHDDSVSMIAMLLVAPDVGRQGLGRAIVKHALVHVNYPVLLYATALGRPLYEAMDFKTVGAVVKHVGRFDAGEAVTGIRPVASEDMRALVELDARAFGAYREDMLHQLLEHDGTAVIAKDGSGYAVSWPNCGVTMIGPVIAHDDATAQTLITSLAAGTSFPVRVDLQADATGMRAWAEQRGLIAEPPAPFMILGADTPPGERRLLYAIAAQALG